MQTWQEFLSENYKLTQQEYEKLSTWRKNVIDTEWYYYVKCYIK